MIFASIWKLESALIIRSRMIVMSLLLFTAAALWSVENGKYWYTYQQAAADSLHSTQVKNYETVLHKLDTMQFIANERKDIETPFTLDWRLKPTTSKPLVPLVALSIGQSDVLSLHKSVRMTQPIFNNDFEEFKNPAQLIAGNFDLSFYLLYLLPLLCIALCYNLYSADQEQGIWKLWQVARKDNATSALFYRLAIRWFVSLLPFLIACLSALFWMKNKPLFSSAAFLQWLMVAFVYAVIWLGICWLIVSFKKNSMQNIMLLLGSWLLLLVAIPGVLNTLATLKVSSANTLALANFREVPEKAWNAPFADHQQLTAIRYSDLAKDTNATNKVLIRSYGYLSMVMDEEKKLHQQLTAETKQQTTKQQQLFWINPAAATMHSLCVLAQSNAAAHSQFEQQVLTEKKDRFVHMWDNMMLDSHYTRSHLEKMPKSRSFKYAPPSQSWTPLLLWILVPLGVGFWARNKKGIM